MKNIDSQFFDRLKNFDAGARFKQLAIQKKKDSPSHWVKVLGLNHRNQVYHRWTSTDLQSKEIIMICDDLGITLSDFYGIQNLTEVISEPIEKYGKRVYIEDQIDDLIKRIQLLENALKI
jgi:hypothetical protein